MTERPEPDWLDGVCPGGLSWDGCYADNCGVDENGQGCNIAQWRAAECTCDPADAPPYMHHDYCETRHPDHPCYPESCKFCPVN